MDELAVGFSLDLTHLPVMRVVDIALSAAVRRPTGGRAEDTAVVCVHTRDRAQRADLLGDVLGPREGSGPSRGGDQRAQQSQVVGVGLDWEQEVSAQEGVGQLVAWVDQRLLSAGSAVAERASAEDRVGL